MFSRQKEQEFADIAQIVMDGIRREMKKYGITQKKMADIWRVSEPTISKKMAGNRGTTLIDLLRFCDVIGISPAVLFPGGTEYTIHHVTLGELIQTACKREMKTLFKEKGWVE